ncbi:hypothetical protein HEP84_47325 [Streptomyces sp. RLB1-33]|nr:hypothetical protein [Streptomyces sp. RLB1-33]QIY75518.1 hypothetical protein HEP84_47325 [Streptomyces sp. RLB1-33]
MLVIQIDVYFDAVHGVTSRYPFDTEAVQRKAAEALPDWVYRYVSAAAGDGRTQQENIDAFKRSEHQQNPDDKDISDLIRWFLNYPVRFALIFCLLSLSFLLYLTTGPLFHFFRITPRGRRIPRNGTGGIRSLLHVMTSAITGCNRSNRIRGWSKIKSRRDIGAFRGS